MHGICITTKHKLAIIPNKQIINTKYAIKFPIKTKNMVEMRIKEVPLKYYFNMWRCEPSNWQYFDAILDSYILGIMGGVNFLLCLTSIFMQGYTSLLNILCRKRSLSKFKCMESVSWNRLFSNNGRYRFICAACKTYVYLLHYVCIAAPSYFRCRTAG